MKFKEYYKNTLKEVKGFKYATKEFIKEMYNLNLPIETAVESIEVHEPK